MADNLTFQTTVATVASGTVIATDDVGGVHYQLVKLAHGAADSATLVSTASGLPVNIVTASAVPVTDNGSTLSIDDGAGSITVDNAGTFAVQASQAGTWSVRAQDGSGNALTSKAAGSERALSVAVVDGSGNQVASFGGGTQYTEGDTDATITGTAILWEDSADTLRAVSAAKPLPIGDAGGSLTVDAPVGTPVFVRLSDGSSAIATLPVSLASLPALAAGTNNIGDVDVLTQPARAATTDTITAKLATDTIQNGTTALTPKFAAISASSSGNNTLIAAVSGKKIRVLRWHLSANGVVNAKFTDGAGGSDLTGPHYLTQYGGFGAAFCPVGHFETTANTSLVLNLSGAVAVGGNITYVEV